MPNPDFPLACSQFGASMGRAESYHSVSPAGKLRIYRVPLDSGGYDPGGAYWGHGGPLYCVEGEGTNTHTTEPQDDTFIHYFRAWDRAAAYRRMARQFGGPFQLARRIQ